MAITTIPWNDGSGDNIYLSASSQTGDQIIEVSSDANSGIARSKTVTFSATGANSVTLTVNQSSGITGDISSYVQDGLVMHLDGINKGNTSGRWSSLVGTAYYTLNTHATSETNAIVMDGAGVLTGTNGVSIDGKTGTIEVCAEYLGNTSSAIILNGSANKRICFIYAASGYTFCINNSNNQWNITKQTLFTCSANATRLMLNGTVGGKKATNNWSNYSNTIGGRSSGTNKYYANVRIHSIRIYNRLLTQDEMLQNQCVDNLRFNLGLTIG